MEGLLICNIFDSNVNKYVVVRTKLVHKLSSKPHMYLLVIIKEVLSSSIDQLKAFPAATLNGL